VGKARKRKVKVTCAVTLRPAAGRIAAARLSRDGVTYARGRSATGARTVRMRAVRPIASGRYTLSTRITDRNGRSAAAVQEVTVRA
jgi:hypothetical protein